MRIRSQLLLCAVAAVLSGCSTGPERRDGPPPGAGAAEAPQRVNPLAVSLLRYDANKDGSVALAELTEGLKAAFAAADKNHDGHLDSIEASAVNDERRRIEGLQMSPIIDWNRDGKYALDEFSASPRGLFVQFDRDEDEVVTDDELNRRGRREPTKRAPPPLGRQQPREGG